jgi:hypothetical protein
MDSVSAWSKTECSTVRSHSLEYLGVMAIRLAVQWARHLWQDTLVGWPSGRAYQSDVGVVC